MSEEDKQNTNSASVPRNYLQEELYKKNVELHFANEFLSVARELYSLSLLSLSSSAFAERATTLIREKLEFEIVGVYTYKQEADELEPLFFAKSERAATALRGVSFHFREIKISNFSKSTNGKNLMSRKHVVLPHLPEFWGEAGTVLGQVEAEANIKNLLLYPLVTEERFIGVFLVAPHVLYESLPIIERDQLKSFADIVAVSIDNAQAHKKLAEVNQTLIEANTRLLKANEEMKGVDEMKSSILSSASHHLQNPLHNIVVGTSMLLDDSFGKVTPEMRKVLAQVFDAARHLNITFKMWLKVLDFENDRVEFKKELFDLATLTKEILGSWKNSAEERGIATFFEASGNPPFTVNADREWIREVVMNLIDNALKMTDKGYVKVKIEHAGANMRLVVEDSGTGMGPETLDRLFQKFEKGKEGWKKDIYGTGLGLYLCKKIIEEGHGGKINGFSKGENKGAIFSFEIPKD